MPVLQRLLLPVGKTLEDVDIYGVAEGGALVYAQVTNHRVSTKAAREKATRLRTYRDAYANEDASSDVRGTGTRLVFFAPGEA